MRKIKEKENIEWNYVNTRENPADIGSRGCHGDELSENWFEGPKWLPKPECWPAKIEIEESDESEKEALATKKMIKEVLATAMESETENIREEILIKHPYKRALRILAWMSRFRNNCMKNVKTRGPLTVIEIEPQITHLLKMTQDQFRERNPKKFGDHEMQLNLKRNDLGLLECRGRIQGEYPVYVPAESVLAEKMVQYAHLKTLQGGVIRMMTHVRKDYWIPKLRQLTKRYVRNCNWCKRFGCKPLPSQSPGLLPTDRTQGTTAFHVIGTDYAGPLTFVDRKKQKKAYILMFSCSVSRAIHLELLEDQTTDGFIRALKKLVARRGKPRKIYSDNAKTFKSAAKWLENIVAGEKLNEFLTEEEIHWQFNLSRAPWWGGQFERLIGLVKQSLYKTIGRANLTWFELEEVLLDLEITLNNRPLSYVEDDIEFPVITPNSLMFGIPPARSLEESPSSIDDLELRKRVRHVQKCKQMLWNRWSNEYVRGLRERHRMMNKSKISLREGEVVLIKGDEKNRGKWKLGRIEKMFPGRDGVIRAVRLRAGKSYLERPLELLYPLELSCVDKTDNKSSSLNEADGGATSTTLRSITTVTEPSKNSQEAAKKDRSESSINSTPNAVEQRAEISDPPVRRSVRLLKQHNLSGSTN